MFYSLAARASFHQDAKKMVDAASSLCLEGFGSYTEYVRCTSRSQNPSRLSMKPLVFRHIGQSSQHFVPLLPQIRHSLNK